MNCNVKRLCSKLIISSAVTFADGTLTVNIPTGIYGNGNKYCIVVAQTIPDTATITAPVVVTIGTGTATYPLLNCDGSAVTAASINARTRYATIVQTTTTGGAFRLVGKLPCSRCTDNLVALPAPDTTTPGG